MLCQSPATACAKASDDPAEVAAGDAVAEDAPAEPERDRGDEREGQRVADEGADQRGDHVAAHQPGQRQRRREVQPEERREGGEDAAGEAERDAVRGVGQPADPVAEILDAAAPAAPRQQRPRGCGCSRGGLSRRLKTIRSGPPSPRPGRMPPLTVSRDRPPCRRRGLPEPPDLRDVRIGVDRGQDVGEVFHIPHLDINDHAVEIGLAVGEDDVGDVGALLADQRADAPEHARRRWPS